MSEARPWIVAVAVVVIGAIIRVAWGGYASLERASQADEAGQLRVAALEYRQTLAWYLPVAPWRAEAADALWELSDKAYQAKRWDDVVMLLNMYRSGILSGRSILGTDSELLARGDERLAEALGRWEAELAIKENRPALGALPARIAHFGDVLAEDRLPSRFWGLLAVLGFLVWLGAAWRSAGV